MKCAECKRVVDQDRVSDVIENGCVVCRDCFREYYKECSVCRTSYHRDLLVSGVCEECYAETFGLGG